MSTAIVGLPLTPLPCVTPMPAPAATERCAQASLPVRTAKPVEPSPSNADKSFASARVGLADTPSPLVTVIPAAGPVIVRAATAPLPVRAISPVDESAAIAARPASRLIVGLADTPSPLVIASPADETTIDRATVTPEAVRTTIPFDPGSTATSVDRNGNCTKSVPSVTTIAVTPSSIVVEFAPFDTSTENPVTAFAMTHQFSLDGTVMVGLAEIPPFVNRCTRWRVSFVV